MKRNVISLLLILLVLASGCNREIGEVTLTYNKATAVDGDLSAIRATPVIA